ncbi:hypothetical protein HDU98_007524 [Podochytrium sp. JEL0797]|nr:hypothetical protein HDU98_007524 [Podochytrium sp. JEL0797]
MMLPAHTLSLLFLHVPNVLAIALKPEWMESRDETTLDKPDEVQAGLNALLSTGPNMSARGVTDSKNNITPYMTDCQYNLMLQMTSFFDTGDSGASFYNQFASCEPTHNGQGITAGFSSFTTCTGSILQVCKKYESLHPNGGFCSKYMSLDSTGALKGPLIDAVHENRCQSTSAEAFISPGLETFCADWATAADTDPVFIKAQESIHSITYFRNTITKYFDLYAVRAPLVKMQMFDIVAQLGEEALSAIAFKATSWAGGSPASSLRPISEDRWLMALVGQRKAYLELLGAPFNSATGRVDAVWDLVNRSVLSDAQIEKNLNLEGDAISIVFQGVAQTFRCTI